MREFILVFLSVLFCIGLAGLVFGSSDMIAVNLITVIFAPIGFLVWLRLDY